MRADALLIEAGARHATVELEDVARCWTDATQNSRAQLVHKNLASLWANFLAVGASRLLLGGLVEWRSKLGLVSAAVPGAAVIVVRLHASQPVLERRIRLREPGPPESELVGAHWWAQHFDEVQFEDHLVETDDWPVGEIARDVLQIAAWLP